MLKIIPILLISSLLLSCGGMSANSPLPEPLGTPTSPSNSACSTPTNWTIQFNRSGGFAGFDESLTLDNGGNLTVQGERPAVNIEKTISDDQVKAITESLAQACPFIFPVNKDECADCFLYDLKVQMDGISYSVQATDMTVAEEMQPLISVLSKLLQDTGQ